MPQNYHCRPVVFERTRAFAARQLFRLSFFIAANSARLLPKCHPVRIFLDERIPELRSRIVHATIPGSNEPKKLRFIRFTLFGVTGAPIALSALGLAIF